MINQENINNLEKAIVIRKYPKLRLVGLIILALILLFYVSISGVEITLSLLTIGLSALFIICDRFTVTFIDLYILYTNKKWAVIVNYLLPLIGILSVASVFVGFQRYKYNLFLVQNSLAIILLVFVSIYLILFFIFGVTYKHKHFIAIIQKIMGMDFLEKDKNNETILDKECKQYFIGQGNTDVDNIIKTIFQRIEEFKKTLNLSFLLMIIIVLIGSLTSVGSTMFSQFINTRKLNSAISSLNEAKNEINKSFLSDDRKLRNYIHELSYAATDNYNYSYYNTNNDSLLTDRVKKVLTDIDNNLKNQIGEIPSLTPLINSVEEKTKISWEEIAMKATIALLTLLLVQIFYQIYRYCHQQINHLSFQAELLELYKEKDANKERLRDGLLTKFDSIPKFGKNPPTPIEQILTLLEKINKTAK